MFLPDAGRHRRGEIDVDEAVATAKLNDARSVEEACGWLKPRERLAVLNDRALIALLARLPARSEPLAEADAGAAMALPSPDDQGL
jgi:membrane glycosyltransferase